MARVVAGSGNSGREYIIVGRKIRGGKKDGKWGKEKRIERLRVE